jgi:hypothetical protein
MPLPGMPSLMILSDEQRAEVLSGKPQASARPPKKMLSLADSIAAIVIVAVGAYVCWPALPEIIVILFVVYLVGAERS